MGKLLVEAEVVSSCDDCLQVPFKLSSSVKASTHQDNHKELALANDKGLLLRFC